MKTKSILILSAVVILVSYILLNMKHLLAILFAFNLSAATPPDSLSIYEIPKNLKKEVIHLPSIKSDFVYNQQLFDLGCDTLSNIQFWRKIMTLDKDSGYFNLPANRKILCKASVNNYESLSDLQKITYRDSLRSSNNLSDSSRILLTNGKSFFYDFDKASLNFHKGINDFIANDVDPWYAQAILLIESPNKLQKSNAGAYGSFQLMKDVARLFGLKVNKHVDERADFDRSAYAASSLIKRICIPKTKNILDSLGIKNYSETDLWFRLLVMHAYHAGAGNVKKALFSYMPTIGDMNLIYTLWHTETKHFKSASQNYSQLVLAAMLEVHEKYGLTPCTPPAYLKYPPTASSQNSYDVTKP